ncbi:MAG: hypothetical protein U0229_18255 [Anaeromyxobacter sp.]
MRNPKMMKLHEEIGELIGGERHKLVEFLRKLHVLDRERGYCEFNCGSTWEYLTKIWHLCEGTAWHRVNAMRYLRRFPQLAEEIASGRINLSQLRSIGRALLTPENVDDVSFARRPAVLQGRRRSSRSRSSRRSSRRTASGGCPPKTTAVSAPAPEQRGRPALPADAPHEPSTWMGTGPECSQDFALTVPVALPPRPDRGEVMPVAKDEYQFRAHLDDETKRLFDELAGLLANVVPDRAPAKLLAIMVRDSLEAQKRKRGLLKPRRARKPAPAKEPTPGIRQDVPDEVRRAVLERDGYRCRFGEEEGHRCEATDNLTMEHRDGALVTGSSTVDELLTYCFPHNLYAAFLKFGPEFMLRKIEEARAERAVRSARREGASQEAFLQAAPSAPLAREEVAEYGAAEHPEAGYAAAA